WQGVDQAIEAKCQDVSVQDPGNYRPLREPNGGRHDPAFESTNQRLDDVPPFCSEWTHLCGRGQPNLRWCPPNVAVSAGLFFNPNEALAPVSLSWLCGAAWTNLTCSAAKTPTVRPMACEAEAICVSASATAV